MPFLHLAGGTYNTALGWTSLGFNVTGNFNTAVGAGTLLANTGDENTATGAGALLSNTTAANGNTADGRRFALFSNTTGNGAGALSSNTSGNDNTVQRCLCASLAAPSSNTTGGANTAIGSSSTPEHHRRQRQYSPWATMPALMSPMPQTSYLYRY